MSNALAVHDLCRDAGVPVWIGGMLESALGGALCVEVATLPNFTYPVLNADGSFQTRLTDNSSALDHASDLSHN